MSIIEKFVNKLKRDGVDHIRIARDALTPVGRAAAQDLRKSFFIPQIGRFVNPICFANWLHTGNEDARDDLSMRTRMPLSDFREFVLYGKFYQLCSMRDMLVREMKDLPMVAYHQFPNGVREINRWKEYQSEVRAMIDHIVDPERGPKAPYPWDEKYPGLTEKINQRIMDMTGIDPNNPPPAAEKPERKPRRPKGSDRSEAAPQAGPVRAPQDASPEDAASTAGTAAELAPANETATTLQGADPAPLSDAEYLSRAEQLATGEVATHSEEPSTV